MIMIMIIYWVETAQLIIDPGNYRQKKHLTYTCIHKIIYCVMTRWLVKISVDCSSIKLLGKVFHFLKVFGKKLF